MAWRYLKKFCSATLIIAAIAAGGALVYIHTGHAKLLSVQSGSMAPVFRKGDLVIVKRIPDKLAVGDVVTFINPLNAKQTVTHRVIVAPGPSTGGRLTTKGDANALPDQPILPSLVVGKVERHVPYAGLGFDLLRTPAGLLALIYVPAALIILDETRRLSAYYKTQKIYRLAGASRRKTVASSGLVAKGGPVALLGVAVCMAVAVPARAALNSSVTLTGNTIQAAAPNVLGTHIVIKKLVLRCSPFDSDSASVRPKIVLYNPTKQPVQIGAWQLRDNSGIIATIPWGTRLSPRHTYEVTPWLGTHGSHGLQYAGDALSLRTNKGGMVDSLSWGTEADTDPAIQDVTAGTRMQRANSRIDTDTAEDWDVWQRDCPDRPHHGGRGHHDHFHHNHNRQYYDNQDDAQEDNFAPDEPVEPGNCSFRDHKPRWDD